MLRRNLTFRAGLGLILDGELKPDGGRKQTVESGGSAAMGLEYHAFAGKGLQPSIDLSMLLSASRAGIKDPDTDKKSTYFATDLRLGMVSSWNLNNRFYPFAAVRVFGGPVSWELEGDSVVGTDIYHYQVAMGSAIRLEKINIYFEWAGMGEKVLSIGVSLSW